MADEEYQSSPDERDPGVDAGESPEDYLAQMKSAMLANEAMRREEQSLQQRWDQTTATAPPNIQAMPPQMPPPVTAPMAAPVAPPTLPQTSVPLPRNRTYMGPMTGAPGASPQEFFGNAPSGTRIMPPPPVAGPEAYDRGVESGLIQPPSHRLQPTDIAFTPAYEQWAAQQDVKAAVEKGVPVEKALMTYPAALGTTGTRRTDTERVVGPGQSLYRNGQLVSTVPPKATAPKLSEIEKADMTSQLSQFKAKEPPHQNREAWNPRSPAVRRSSSLPPCRIQEVQRACYGSIQCDGSLSVVGSAASPV
jgi:hypothetical protein